MEIIMESTLALLVLSGLTGYLIGSISFARLLTWMVTKSSYVKPINEPVPGSDIMFQSNSVSATAAHLNLGKKYGCLTALLDMSKVAIPTFLFSMFFTDQPYYLLVAASGIAGHIYPVYHRFKGGRGESPMLGAMLVINWFGIIIANAASLILGFLTGSVMVIRYGWYVLMIFWYWIYFDSYFQVIFMVIANFLFWFSMRHDLATFADLKKVDDLEVSEEAVSDFLLMGKGLGRFIDRYGLPALVKRLLKK
ncbi:MAG: glycerol-3-phosphate acyltransferase [Bacteroides sp.]|nr:glycerol-3-phosphate acyltransferase [Bacteroides sp.]